MPTGGTQTKCWAPAGAGLMALLLAAASPLAAPAQTNAAWRDSVEFLDGKIIGDKHGDPFMGEYVGKFTSTSNSAVVDAEAKVYPMNKTYKIVLFVDPLVIGTDEDRTRHELTGTVTNDTLPFTGEGWSGVIRNRSLSATSTIGKVGSVSLPFHVRVSPTLQKKPPEGATVLLPFEPGTKPSIEAWSNDQWLPKADSSMQVVRGDNQSTESFGSFFAHVEFMPPFMPTRGGQGRGNSGVYLHGRYEVQVLDSFGLIQKDNDCGGIYKISAASVNACLPPARWQTYDITFSAPQFDEAGKKVKTARVRVEHNGILIHDDQELPNSTGGARGAEAPLGPLRFQDHGNPVRFRNVWIVPMDDTMGRDPQKLLRSMTNPVYAPMASRLLHGMALKALTAKLEAGEKPFADVMAAELAGDHSTGVKCFIIRQLEFAGLRKHVAPVARFLTGAETASPAARTVTTLGGEAAMAALRSALPKADEGAKLSLVKALALLGDTQSAPHIIPLAKSKDRDLRLCAIGALSKMGKPEALPPIQEALATTDVYERSVVTAAALELGRTMIAGGFKDKAAAIYQDLWDKRTGPTETHIRCAALRGLAAAQDTRAMPLVLEAMQDDDPQIRSAAVDAGVAMPSEEATQLWIGRMKQANAVGKSGLIRLLERRGDPMALPAVREGLSHKEPIVRIAAIPASARLGGKQVVPELLPFLDAPDEERSAAVTALRDIPGEGISGMLSDDLESASARRREAVLRILTMRGTKETLPAILRFADDADPGVRVAVLRALGSLGSATNIPAGVELVTKSDDQLHIKLAEQALVDITARIKKGDPAAPILDLLDSQPSKTYSSLIRVLGRIGSDSAFEALRKAVSSEDAEIQNTAIRVMAGLTKPRAAPYLWDVASKTDNLKHHVIAFRGFVRITSADLATKQNERVTRLLRAMRIAKRLEERRLAMSGLARIHSVRAMQALVEYIEDPNLQDEASAAILNIASGYERPKKSTARAIVRVLGKLDEEDPLTGKPDRFALHAQEIIARLHTPEIPDVDDLGLDLD